MPKAKHRRTLPKREVSPVDQEVLTEHQEVMEAEKPLPRIDRRHTPRTSYQTTAWLTPADDTGAIRRPIIRTRDLTLRSMGFRTRQDISALGEAILRLPATTGRYIAVNCKVRRSREVGNGWFDCLIEFLQPQPDLAHRHAQLCDPKIMKPSHKKRRPK